MSSRKNRSNYRPKRIGRRAMHVQRRKRRNWIAYAISGGCLVAVCIMACIILKPGPESPDSTSNTLPEKYQTSEDPKLTEEMKFVKEKDIPSGLLDDAKYYINQVIAGKDTGAEIEKLCNICRKKEGTKAYDYLCKIATDHENPKVRQVALMGLASSRQRDYRVVVKKALKDGDFQVRLCAVAAMGMVEKKDKEASLHLPEIAKDITIGSICDQEEVEALINMLSGEKTAKVRTAIVDVLAHSKSMMDLPTYRRVAVARNGKLPISMRVAVVRDMGKSASSETLEGLCELAADRGCDAVLRKAVLDELAAVSTEPEVNTVVAKIFGDFRDDLSIRFTAGSILCKDLNDVNAASFASVAADGGTADMLRLLAVDYLAKCPGEKGVAVLEKISKDDASSAVRKAATKALERLES